MIAPDGYLVLRDVAFRLYIAQLTYYESEVYEKTSTPIDSVEVMIGRALKKSDNLSVYSPEGQLYKVSENILDTVRQAQGADHMRIFAFLDTFSMRVDLSKVQNHGQSARIRKFGRARDRKYVYRSYHHSLAREFRPIDGFYLTCPIGELDLRKQFEELRIPEVMNDNLEQIESELRKRISEGSLPARDQFKREIAPNLKADSFKAIWRAVALDHPEISKPGPKTKKSR